MDESHGLTDELANLLISLRMKSSVDGLLRDAKNRFPDNKEIRLSGNTEQLVRENLHRAVASGAIRISSIQNAIRDHEESRAHYRLYYSIADPPSTELLNNNAYVRAQLLGAHAPQLPNLLVEPAGEVWADLRTTPRGWRAKLYRGGDRWVLSKAESTSDEQRRVKVWTREYSREVWCITWDNTHKMLVLQIPYQDSATDYADSFNGIRAIAAKLLTLDKLEPFSITKSVVNLMNDYARIKDRVRIIVADLGSANQGRALLSTHTDSEHMIDDTDLAQAVQLFSGVNEATIIWLKSTLTDVIQEETRTIVGRRGTNAVLFTAASTPTALEYISDELVTRANA